MIAIALSLLAFTAAYAAPVEENKLASAAEVFGLITPSQMACLRKEHYKVVLTEAYADGEFKKDAIPTAWAAVTTKMGVEIYMTPDATHKKSAKEQVDETIQGLISKGLPVPHLWIKVTDSSKWTPSIMLNNAFLQDLVEAAEAHGRKVGIITNSAAFYKITPGLDNFSTMLWYDGAEGANFGDFKPFAGWTKPSGKQYSVGGHVCDITINGNVVSTADIWTPSS